MCSTASPLPSLSVGTRFELLTDAGNPNERTQVEFSGGPNERPVDHARLPSATRTSTPLWCV
jgi:hypothetical protein